MEEVATSRTAKGLASRRFLEEFEAGDIVRHWPACALGEARDARRAQAELLALAHRLATRGFGVRRDASLFVAISEVRFLRPSVAGDVVSAHSEVLAVRSSRRDPGRGVLDVLTSVTNQHGDRLLAFRRAIVLPRRLRASSG